MEVKPDINEEKVRVLKLPYKVPKLLAQLLDGFKYAVHEKNQSAVFVIDGWSGLGKSTLSFQAALYCDPYFNLDNVCFTPDQFLNRLERAKKGDFIVFDEAMLINNRSTMSEINRAIVIAMSMIRSKNVIVCFNINSIFDLDKNIALHRADLLLNVYADSLTDRGKFMAFFKSVDKRDRIKELYLRGKKFYSYAEPKSNFNTTFGPYFIFSQEEYDAKKDQGVNEFLNRDKRYETKDKQQRDNYILWMRENTELTLAQIAEVGKIALKTVTNVLRRHGQ